MMKMTYAQAIDNALEIIDTVLATDSSMWENLDVTRDKLEALKAQLAKRNSGERKPTKTQMENNAYKATIVEYLTTVDAPKTIKEMQAEIADIAGLTNQRITHMLTDLVKAGTLAKEYVKKTPYYSIAA